MAEITGLSPVKYDNNVGKNTVSKTTAVDPATSNNLTSGPKNDIYNSNIKSNDNITISNLMIKVDDIDGIDTNSKGDLNASIKGNIKISKELIESSVAQLKEDLKKKHIDCDIRVDVNPNTNEYNITIHKGVDLAHATLKMTDGGIDTSIGFSKFLKVTAFVISPLATMIADPDKLLANFVKNKLTKDLGLTTIADPDKKNQFKLVPDLKNNKLLKEIPVGNMKLYLEDIKDNKSRFDIDPKGNIIIDLDIKAKGSTNPQGMFAKDEVNHDAISARIDAAYHADKSANISITDTKLDLDITESELPDMQKQLQGFGEKISKVGGKISISDIDEQISISPEGKSKVEDQHSGHIQLNDFKFKEGNTEINLKSTDGNINFEQKPDGSQVFNVNAKNITGQINPTHSPITLENLSLDGNIIQAQDKDKTLKIAGQSIKADRINVNQKVDLTNVDVTNTTINIGTKSGDISFVSNGGRTNVKHLNVSDKAIIDGISFTGSVKVEKNGNVTIDGDKIIADSLVVNKKVDIKNLNVTNAVVEVAKKGDVSFTSKGGRANIGNLNINGKNNLENISFVGNVKVEKGGRVIVESKHLTLEGNFGGTQINFSPAKNANFAGKVVYDKEAGVTVSGLDGSKNASIKNLSGSIGKFKLEDLTTETSLILDKKGDIKLVDASKIKLNSDGLQVSGNDLQVTKSGDDIGVKTQNSKLSVTTGGKGKPPQKLASDVVMDGSVAYNDKTKNVSFGNGTEPLKIKSGNISGVDFKNFAIKGGFQLGKNNSINLHGPTEFTGSATFDKTTISNFKSKGDISFDNSPQKKVITINDKVSLDLQMNKQDLPSHLETSGLIKITQENENTSISTAHAVINGKLDKTVCENFDFQGNINFDSKTKLLSFNNKAEPFKINSGSVAGVSFKDFSASGEIQMDKNNSVVIKGPTSFTGTASFQGTTIKNFNSAGTITFNNSPDKKAISLSDKVDLEVVLDKQKENLKISTDGHIDLKQDGDKYILTSSDGVVNGKFGDISLENLKFQGKLIYDTKTQQITVEKLNETTPFSLSGKIGANDFAVNSTSDDNGSLTINKTNNGLKVDAKNIKIAGQVDGINFKTIENGINGEITLPKGGKPTATGLDFGLEVEGVKVTAKGDIANKDGEYKVHLSGSFEADKGKLNELIDKVSKNANLANNPQAKKKLDDLKQLLAKFDLEKIKYQDLDLSLDKDMNYSVSVTATDLNLNFPEKAISIVNNPPGKITLKLDSNNNLSLASDGTKLNANLNGTVLKDFNIKGEVDFTPANSNGPQKLNFKQSSGRAELKGFEVSGTVINKGFSKEVSLKADADVAMNMDKDGMSFEGKNFNLTGIIDGFNIKNLPTANADTPNPTYASGKVTFKKDGFVDISELSFALEFEGITLTNKSGGLKTSGDGYELKVSGNVSTSIDKIESLLQKVAVNSSTPEAAKKSVKDTIANINKYVSDANITEVNYKNLTIDFDKNLKVKDFQIESNTTITDAKIKLDSLGLANTITFDKIELSANSATNENNKFYIKSGNLSFNMNDEMKAAISDAVKKTISENGKIPHGKLKDLQIDISPDGLVTVKGGVNMYKIANVNLGVTIAINGKELDISIDKARLKGFLGLIQGAIQPITGKAENIITAKLVDAAAEKVKIEYNGKGNLIKVDLQTLMSKYVSDKATLNSIEIKNNHVNVSYGSTYRSEKDYDLKTINDLIRKFNDGKITEQDTNDLLNLSAENLSLVFTKVSIVPELVKNLGEKNTYNLMKKLADNQGVGSNSKHLTEFINQNKVSEKVLKLLLQNMSKEQYQTLSPEIKTALSSRLSKK